MTNKPMQTQLEEKISSYKDYDLLYNNFTRLKRYSKQDPYTKECLSMNFQEITLAFSPLRNIENIRWVTPDYNFEGDDPYDGDLEYLDTSATLCTSLNIAISYLKYFADILPFPPSMIEKHEPSFLYFNTITFLSLFEYISENRITLDLGLLNYALSPFEILQEHKGLDHIGFKHGGIDIDKKRYIDYLNSRKPQTDYAIVHCTDLFKVCISTLEILALCELPLLKCELCGRYFAPKSRSDEKYCDFYNKEYPNKTCKEAAKIINLQKRNHTNDNTKLSKKIYNRLRARAERSGLESDRSALYAFQAEKDAIKQDIASGKSSEADLLEWLKRKDIETKNKR